MKNIAEKTRILSKPLYIRQAELRNIDTIPQIVRILNFITNPVSAVPIAINNNTEKRIGIDVTPSTGERKANMVTIKPATPNIIHILLITESTNVFTYTFFFL